MFAAKSVVDPGVPTSTEAPLRVAPNIATNDPSEPVAVAAPVGIALAWALVLVSKETA